MLREDLKYGGSVMDRSCFGLVVQTGAWRTSHRLREERIQLRVPTNIIPSGRDTPLTIKVLISLFLPQQLVCFRFCRRVRRPARGLRTHSCYVSVFFSPMCLECAHSWPSRGTRCWFFLGVKRVSEVIWEPIKRRPVQ